MNVRMAAGIAAALVGLVALGELVSSRTAGHVHGAWLIEIRARLVERGTNAPARDAVVLPQPEFLPGMRCQTPSELGLLERGAVELDIHDGALPDSSGVVVLHTRIPWCIALRADRPDLQAHEGGAIVVQRPGSEAKTIPWSHAKWTFGRGQSLDEPAATLDFVTIELD